MNIKMLYLKISVIFFLGLTASFSSDEEVSSFYEERGLTPLTRDLAITSARCADMRSESIKILGILKFIKSDIPEAEHHGRLRPRSISTCLPAKSFWCEVDKLRTQAVSLIARAISIMDTLKVIQLSECDSAPEIVEISEFDDYSLSESGKAALQIGVFLVSELPLYQCKYIIEERVLSPDKTISFPESSLFARINRAGQNYLLSMIENSTLDLQWIRKLLEAGFDPAIMDARQFLAFIDTICLNVQTQPLLPENFMPLEKNPRTRLIAFREFLKLQSVRHHMSTPGRKIIAELHQRLGFPSSTNMTKEQLDSNIYLLGKALARQSDLNAISKHLLRSNTPMHLLKLASKHILLRHPQTHDVLSLLGLNLAKHSVPIGRFPGLSKKLTFVGSKEPIGDGMSPEKMDFFYGNQYPWLSLILPMITEQGYTFEVLDWQDPTIDWSARKCIFIGPVWGYSKQGDTFNRWLDQRQIEGIKLVNPLSFLRWNAKKTYLLDLQSEGIPVVPTYIAKEESLEELLEIAQEKWQTTDVIFKGVIGAGGFDYLHHKDSNATSAHLDELRQHNNGIVMQPFCPEVSLIGEFSFVFIGNSLSHMYIKVCKKGEERVQVFYGGRSFHFTDKYGNNPPKAAKKTICQFKKAFSLEESYFQEIEQQTYSLWTKITDYMIRQGINIPPVCRLDCVWIKNQLKVMEIEGLDPYLEFKEASQYMDQRLLLTRYTNELLRQHTLNG